LPWATHRYQVRPRRKISTANAHIVHWVTEQGFKAAEVARSLDINENLIHRWKTKFSQSESDTENDELKLLREEVKRLRMERDTLKKRQPSLPEKINEIPLHRRT
jgi:transposase